LTPIMPGPIPYTSLVDCIEKGHLYIIDGI
jgi:hypothetical protein